jgi:hypothetical protein
LKLAGHFFLGQREYLLTYLHSRALLFRVNSKLLSKLGLPSYKPSMSEELTPSSKKANRPRSFSKGEELWQVHLQRSLAAGKNLDDEDDHDFPEPRHPKRSIGEELFEVHLKRSKGLEPDYDTNDEQNDKDVVGDKANKAG